MTGVERLKQAIEQSEAEEKKTLAENYDYERQTWIQRNAAPVTILVCGCTDEELIPTMKVLAEKVLANSNQEAVTITFDDARREHDQYLSAHYDLGTLILLKDKTCSQPREIQVKPAADEDTAANFKERLRLIRNSTRELKEEMIVNAVVADTDLYQRYMPLVSRRKHQELWHLSAKLDEPDGSVMIMGEHKHRIGNRQCRACPPKIKERIANTDDVSKAMSTIDRDMDWCPRFIIPLRRMNMVDYFKTINMQNSCYAGLLHTHILLEQDAEGKTLVTVTKKCDTCGFEEVIQTEGMQENQVQAGEQIGSTDLPIHGEVEKGEEE